MRVRATSKELSARLSFVGLLVVCLIGFLHYRQGWGHWSTLENKSQGVAAGAASPVSVTVDNSVQHQVIDGFGQAEPSSLVYIGGPGDVLTPEQRSQAIEKAFNQVGLNMGTIGSLLESPGDYSQRQNDNDDPNNINWNGFNAATTLIPTKEKLVDLAKPYGFTGYYLGAEAPNVRWASPWLEGIRSADYNRYLDEVAEQVLADVTFWKNNYGEEQPYYMLGNEQLSGNRALSGVAGFGPDPYQQMVDITKKAGARVRSAGFNRVKFLVGTEETEEISLRLATAILADPDARQYVGAVGYHTYPYGSIYSSVTGILSTSGQGMPDPGRVAVRNQLGDLGRSYNVPIWLTENSHAGPPLSYDDFRARAIHVHDEFIYADASAYFGEGSMWSLASQRLHIGNDNLYGADNEGNVVFINNDTGAIDISGIGYAIGQYARWVKPGSVRIEASSSDPLLQVTAFRNDQQSHLVLVAINNNTTAVTLSVSIIGLTLSGNVNGEQSTSAAYWQPLMSFVPNNPLSFSIQVPAQSVTTLVGTLGSTGPGSSQPKIIGASISGKNLIVSGANFDSGATIVLDGADQRTRNDAQAPSTTLIGKKSGKKIPPGHPVKLQVRNSDGSLSPEFDFTRSS